MNAPLPESIRKALESVTLDDKYALERGRAFMSGVQALVRLPMLQRQRDALAGLNTAGFISGYRGSPLGGYDQALWAAKKHLAEQHIVFQPGVNEELARHRGLGHAAARPVPEGQEVRRRLRHLVRQGPGRGPLLRRVQARQHGRHLAPRRRDRDRRRRPCLQEQHRAAPERPHLQGLRHAGVLPQQRAGHPRHGAACVRDEPLLRRVERHEDDPGGRRVVGLGDRRPGPRQDRDARGLRDAARAACTSAGPTRRWSRKRG